MIVVVARVRTDTSKREQLVRVGQELARASRAEAGCIGYRLYEDSESANDFVFVEEWESKQTLQEHFRTQHVADFMRAVPAAIVGAPDVKFHDVAGSSDLSEVSAG
jgi:quinol monooxygenase YgiN